MRRRNGATARRLGMNRDAMVRDLFTDHGWLAVNAHASLGEIDVLAYAVDSPLCPWTGEPLATWASPLAFCEVKANEGSPFMNFRTEKRQALAALAARWAAPAFLVYWPTSLDEPRWIPSTEWPQVRPVR